MTVAAHRTPNGDERLRIAITSPDILAQIRQVFAGKNLVVDIVGMPYVEVAVRPATPHADPATTGTALRTLVNPDPVTSPPSPKRLRAEYRLSVIRADEDRPRATVTRRRQRPRTPSITGSPDTKVGGKPDAGAKASAKVKTKTDTNAKTNANAKAKAGAKAKASANPNIREITLSQRQREVMTLMSRGARNAEIAEMLHVTEKTVKNHINRIFRELGAKGRVDAVLVWQRYQAEAAGRPAWPSEV